MSRFRFQNITFECPCWPNKSMVKMNGDRHNTASVITFRTSLQTRFSEFFDASTKASRQGKYKGVLFGVVSHSKNPLFPKSNPEHQYTQYRMHKLIQTFEHVFIQKLFEMIPSFEINYHFQMQHDLSCHNER